MGYALFYFFKKNLSSFKENKSGAVAFMFVVLFIPIMTLSGGIIDYGKSIGLEKKLESAVDTAILAGAHYVVSSNKKNDKDIENYVKKVFNINFKSDPFYNNGVVLKVSIPPGRTGIEMTATSSSKTNFLQILGINKINVNASGQVKFASTESLDVVLVLDNSGSMQNESKMLNLKNASNNLMTSLFGDVTKNHPSLQIGLVPFSSTIRFPMKYRHALWLDHNGRSPIHSENFAYHMNRFVMIKKLKYAWGGCVEVRPQPYDIHDYDPSKSEMSAEDLKLKTSKNARFFVPWFAPDFPEVSGYGNGILQSNYLTDEHDDAHQATKYPIAFSNDPKIDIKKFPEAKGQSRRKFFFLQANNRKYYIANRRRSNSTRGGKVGPNWGCARNMSKIKDLDNDLAPLKREISSYHTGGGTNILQAFTWGWRLLTPGEPFTKGRSLKKNPNQKKIIILLSDGDQTYPAAAIGTNPNLRTYSAFGLPYTNRLNRPEKDRYKLYLSNFRSYMNERLMLACDNAKKNGIRVFSISFGKEIYTEGKEILKYCATDDTHYFHSKNTELNNVFQSVASQISKLYLSK